MSTAVPITGVVKNSLSAARMSTYEAAMVGAADSPASALALYAWNAQVSAALMAPLHICEVVVRNAVSDALEVSYGNNWPWSPGFERSLPNPTHGYSQPRDLLAAKRGAHTVGKVIPELKFVFWQKMFTSRHDFRVWGTHLRRVFPNLDSTKSVAQHRQTIYDDLEHIRMLRNRIAHHEPIFQRNLADDFVKITALIGFRCQVTANWMLANQQATAMFVTKPTP